MAENQKNLHKNNAAEWLMYAVLLPFMLLARLMSWKSLPRRNAVKK